MNWLESIDLYCERTGPELWSEPLNALSNLAFIGVAALLWRRAGGRHSSADIRLLLALDYFPTHRGLASSCQSFLQMMFSSLTAGVVAPALWSSVVGLAAGMVGNLLLGLASFGLWWALYHRTRAAAA